jgi:diguanylate cyclase (GGDEF)-like protein
MSRPGTRDSTPSTEGAHFSCSLSATLLAYINDFGGTEAVKELFVRSRIQRTPEYLLDIGNWISYEETVALWEAGAFITGDPYFARHLGESTSTRLNASPVAALLRSLGSPEAAYRQIAITATKFAVITEQEVLEIGPGFVEFRFVNRPGFERSAYHCGWTEGLLTQTPVLFGLPPAIVEHHSCKIFGAEDCRFRVTWQAEVSDERAASAQEVALRQQLDAMTARLQSMFATASDLIAEGDLDTTLAAITDRAALEVRAPRYLLAVRPAADAERHLHHRGLTNAEAAEFAERLATEHPEDLPDTWLAVPVSSSRYVYGHLLAVCDEGQAFFAQEHELLEVYARYAATALDTATALLEAKRRHDQASALLDLARTLATAGTSDEVATRLAEAVPLVIDCDRVGVYLWDEVAGELRRRVVTSDEENEREVPEWSIAPEADGLLAQWLEHPDQEPVYIDVYNGQETLREAFAQLGAVASVVVPIASSAKFLGTLAVSVLDRPERLKLTGDLRDRLSGVAAHATTALENGRLVDRITHQAHHDSLTGLANRAQLRLELARRTSGAPELAQPLNLFYLDLNGFKPINDEYGHETGDRLLCAVGERLSTVMRGDDVVARLGGDEFAILLVGVSEPEIVEMVTKRIADVFGRPFEVDGRPLTVGASIGRAAWPDDARSIDALIRHADAAMYEAKREHHAVTPRAA